MLSMAGQGRWMLVAITTFVREAEALARISPEADSSPGFASGPRMQLSLMSLLPPSSPGDKQMETHRLI